MFILCFSFLPQGVTYCGESKASTLTMQNVPWHEEVMLLKLLTLPTNSDSFDQAGFNNLDCCPLNFNCLCPLILLHLHWFSFSGEFACPSSSTESFFTLFQWVIIFSSGHWVCSEANRFTTWLWDRLWTWTFQLSSYLPQEGESWKCNFFLTFPHKLVEHIAQTNPLVCTENDRYGSASTHAERGFKIERERYEKELGY